MPERRVISADSHVIEPWDLWQKRVPKEFRERAPRLERTETTDRVFCGEIALPPVGMMAGCLRPSEVVRIEGRWDEDIPAACYDPDARIPEVERDGIEGEVIFPTLSLGLLRIEDVPFKWALLRAYNSWLAEDFCVSHPDRYKGIALLTEEDVDLAVEEVKRARQLGLVGVMLPTLLGGTFEFHDRRFDPLWEVCAAERMPVHLHGSTAGPARTDSLGFSYDSSTGRDTIRVILRLNYIQRALGYLTFGGVFDRHPDLLVLGVEQEAGWASDFMARCDWEWQKVRSVKRAEFETDCERPPSSYWADHIKLTFLRDRTVPRILDLIGSQLVMFSTDFPHKDSTYPHSQKIATELLGDLDEDARDQLLYRTAAELYGFDL